MNTRSLEEDRVVAIHEAGHAIMHCIEGIDFIQVSIKPDSAYGSAGCVSHAPVGSADLDRLEDSEEQDALARRWLRISWGGPIANRVAGQSIEDEVWELDRRDIYDFGSRCIGSEEAVYAETESETEQILRRHWSVVERIARELIERRVVTAAELARLLAARD